MIKYLGSKRRLVPHLVACLGALPDAHTVLDAFSGTSRVGHALKAAGHTVVANDHNAYAHMLARCYVQADARHVLEPARRALARLRAAPPRRGYITRTFCEEARFFRPENGRRIDGIRAAIRARRLDPDVEAVCLASLLEAADRVDSTIGVQMAYLKQWATRAARPLELRVPALLPGRGTALRLDAEHAVRTVEADVVYLDPPYNQHSYRANYHVWETLVRDDAPESYGVARKRVDCQTRKSPFNSKRQMAGALARLVDGVRAPHLVLSFNDEGFVSREAVEALLGPRGPLATFAIDQHRHVGARIGIHDRRGRRVGRVGRLRNREFLFVQTPRAADLDAVEAALAHVDPPMARLAGAPPAPALG